MPFLWLSPDDPRDLDDLLDVLRDEHPGRTWTDAELADEYRRRAELSRPAIRLTEDDEDTRF